MLWPQFGNLSPEQFDFYSWDGTFLRSFPGGGFVLPSVDGAYFIITSMNGDLCSSDGWLVRKLSTGLVGWAGDGDYLCGLSDTGSGYVLSLEDVIGNTQQIRLQVPADLTASGNTVLLNGCSMTTNRALISGSGSSFRRMALMSLPDGSLLQEFDVPVGCDSGWLQSESTDLHWVAATTNGSTGSCSSDVIDTTTGTVVAQLGGSYATFMPDGRALVGNSPHNLATVVDWRTKTILWTGQGQLAASVGSDPATDKMMLMLVTANSSYDYWIVDGQSSKFRLDPSGCAPIEASPARDCAFG